MRYKILKITLNIFLINIIIFQFGAIVKSENDFEYFINDFLYKNSKALKILKEIEFNLKNGSRENSCSMQKDAAEIGLLATESLFKAYELNKTSPPFEIIESNKKRWNSLLENCEE